MDLDLIDTENNLSGTLSLKWELSDPKEYKLWRKENKDRAITYSNEMERVLLSKKNKGYIFNCYGHP